MTDKQIIIDGVDVSGCEFFDECEVKPDWSDCLAHCSPYPEGACYGDCSEYPNCYYKQLKRKEQECYEYSKELARFQQEVVPKYRERLKAKEQECEELKRINKANAKSFLKFWFKFKKYKQTLAEIKELMKIEIECKTYEIENDCFNETRCKALKEHINFTNEILRKISEVKNG